jgi:uncharacterized membrane protein YedE/YeeE
VVARIGFADFAEIQKMFTLADGRLWGAFAGAVALLMAPLHLLDRRFGFPKKPVTRGTVPGALLFGAGWALTGGCPAILLIQAGAGQSSALITLFGFVLGAHYFTRFFAKKAGFNKGGCSV